VDDSNISESELQGLRANFLGFITTLRGLNRIRFEAGFSYSGVHMYVLKVYPPVTA
jgi:hypothetical protein